jgi:hypothetical protein
MGYCFTFVLHIGWGDESVDLGRILTDDTYITRKCPGQFIYLKVSSVPLYTVCFISDRIRLHPVFAEAIPQGEDFRRTTLLKRAS